MPPGVIAARAPLPTTSRQPEKDAARSLFGQAKVSYAAFGLLVTLVWLYIEVLRLLSKLSSRD